ncbi:MAG: hydrolase [Gammaproteobacteria bacterium]|jgi:nicotinamidase-related amidase|nr:hydrolase [Gammaproteobacteria bacterium]MBU0771861.1 hydrolase [Gammaproteobacteria bacterium]MBU0856118.1 hydrolase [Gammaproteobacteria bacterium]MBU1846179.1 hydrolase [Gammaproteobacteria bacterium]
MLIDRQRSSLLLIDMQERLLPAMDDADRLLDNVVWMVKIAQRLSVPVMVSEQYPKGLGPTVPELRALIPESAIVPKMHFSCVADGCLKAAFADERPQVIVCGIESHICVLQTSMDLQSSGKQVYVVADCVASRDPSNRGLALERMRQHGVVIVSREMVAFEWLGAAGSDEFREISRTYLR